MSNSDQLTEDQLLALMVFARYAEAFWSVQPKTGGAQPFLLNPCQRIIESRIGELRKSGRAPRVKVLKARQQGVSTYATAFAQHSCQTLGGHRALSVADKLELPRLWLRRARRWWAQTPAPLRPAAAHTNALELYFSDIDSRYSIASQAGQTPGMGFTLHGLHGSELSNWADPTKVMGDVMPAIPKGSITTWVIFESTGEMVGDWWYESVMSTVNGEDDFELVFLPWFLSTEYVMPPEGKFGEKDYTREEREFVKLAERWARENPDDVGISAFRGVGPGHVWWRRWTIANEFAGDEGYFRSRYPASIDEAFLSVGSLALPVTVIRQHGSTVRAPKIVGQLEDGEDVRLVPALPGDEGAWYIYAEPDEFSEYAIGSDVAEGKAVDKNDARSDRDYSAIVVLDRRTLHTVAVYHGRVAPDLLGHEMIKAARWYNDAWMAPEVNNNGWATIAVVKEWPYLMGRHSPEDYDTEVQLHRLGWRTDQNSRNKMIADWVAHCRPDPKGSFEGQIVCLSEHLAQEEQTFVVTKTGKREHRPGCHDDVLFAAMIALQVHKTCPHERRRMSTVKEFAAYETYTKRPSYAYAGGFDSGIEQYEVDDGTETV